MIAVEGLRKVAVVVRTHVTGPKVDELLRSLSAGSLFDVFVLANETSGPLDFGGYAKLSHSLDDLESLGFGRRDQYFFNHCSDLVFPIIHRKIPGYDHYVLVEFDVHLPRGNGGFFDALVRALSSAAYGDTDLTCVALRGSNPKWMWHAASAAFFPLAWAIFFPIVGMTPRAIEHCYRRRLDELALHGDLQPASHAGAENWVYCESFVPSAMLELGYRMVDIAEIFPGCYRWPQFNAGPPRLLGEPDAEDSTLEVVHPVLEPESFLEKYLFWARHSGKLPDLLRDLRGHQWPLPSELARSFEARVASEVEALPPDQREPSPPPPPPPPPQEPEPAPVPEAPMTESPSPPPLPERPNDGAALLDGIRRFDALSPILIRSLRQVMPYAEDDALLPPVGIVRDFVKPGGPNIDAWRYWLSDVDAKDEDGRYEHVLRDSWPVPDTANREGYCPGDHLAYWLCGYADYMKTVEAAARYGVSGGRVYELGGGTGRVYRHFAAQSDAWETWSSDFRLSSVRWSLEHFPPEVRVFANTSAPALPLPDGYFDLVTAYSVFTHINEAETQWLLELRRILKVGGIGYLSIHDEETWRTEDDFRRQVAAAAGVSADEPLPRGKTVAIWRQDDPYHCNVFHAADHIRNVWGRYFEVLDVKSRWVGPQAAVILRRNS